MAEVKLSDGRGLVFDLSKITISEFRALLDPARNEGEGDELLGRCVGLTADEIGALPYPDYRVLVEAFYKTAREPLADPNSPSASTSG